MTRSNRVPRDVTGVIGADPISHIGAMGTKSVEIAASDAKIWFSEMLRETVRGKHSGNLIYDGSIIMQGTITSPSWTEEFRTKIHLTKGDFKFINPLENKYKIENGAKLIVDNGNVVVGNVFGRKYRIEDPEGRVGIYETREQRTHISAPKGKILLKIL